MLSPEQFAQLIGLLKQIVDKPIISTITGMQDWPMLAITCGMFGGILLMMIGGGLGYILSTIERDRRENREEHCRIWQAQEDCQDDCCPRGNGHQPRARKI